MAEKKAKAEDRPNRPSKAKIKQQAEDPAAAAREAAKSRDKTGIEFVFEDGAKFVLDGSTLNMRERIELEDYVGRPAEEIFTTKWIASDRATAFLAFLARRRQQPAYTLDEVLDQTEMKVTYGVVPPKTPADSGRKD